MPTPPRPPLATSLDDCVAKIMRLIRRRAGQHAYTNITIVMQDGVPVRVKEERQATLADLTPEEF